MHRIAFLAFLVACSTSSSSKPTGTPNDPVDVCERVADVCRIDKAKLGVCTRAKVGTAFTCVSQH